jgi:crotonobetainyl-CoA:carnitine CoA-transferase CaiB-like acyl-CoA transferase
MKTKTTQEWQVGLEKHDIPWAPTHSIEDLIDDPHLRSVNLLQTIDHPTEGRLRMIAPPIKFSATPASIYRHPPGLGEHTAEVLAELAQRAPATQSPLALVSSKAD